MGLKRRFSMMLIGIVKAVEGFVMLALVFGATSLPVHAQKVSATLTVGVYPGSVAVNPNTNEIYVASGNSNTYYGPYVTVIDGATNNAGTITVGGTGYAAGIGLNPNTNQIYVATGFGDTVFVIDGSTNTYTTTINVGSSPYAVAVNPNTNQIYIANSSSNNVTVIDGATNTTTATVSVGSSPVSMAVNPNTNQIYVANNGSNNVTVIDGATNTTTATVSVGSSPVSVAVNPNTNQIYVANNGSNNVTVIDGATNTTTTVAVGTTPDFAAVNTNTNKIYVANNGSNNVTVIDGATNNTTTVPAGTLPSPVAVDETTNRIYVLNPFSNNVTVIDGATNTTTTVAVSQGTWWGSYPMAVDPNTDKIYVANMDNGGAVTVIDGRTATSARVASNLNPSPLNAKVTFTASVTPNLGTGIPTGTVSFEDGSTLLGTGTLNASGVAKFTVSNLTVGQHSITAVYGGDGNNIGSTSSVLAQTVNQQADFALTAITTSLTVAAGSSGKFALAVTPQGSFTTAISFSCSGLPALAGCTFNPASVTPNSSTVNTTLTITTAANTASLARPFGRRSSPLYAIWLVLPAMLLGTVGLAPPKRRKLLGYCIVFLLVSGCLLQVACGGTSNSGGGGGGTSGTPAGTYTITATGTAGSTQHATTVKLTVQ